MSQSTLKVLHSQDHFLNSECVILKLKVSHFYPKRQSFCAQPR
ncbi:hypothetical protein HMPREF1431_01308 [Helicobacter pylori GAMchJs106B]|nr:hypothetical protein HMPREF1431_01308 [Helicobacter pylori GAMchJs106B]